MPSETQSRPVALIGGVGPGLGASLCRRLCEEGYAVVGLARSAEQGAALADGLDDAAFRFIPCDITDEAAVDGAVGEIVATWGPPTVLVHNAGQVQIKPFAEVTPTAFEAMWRVTVLGAMLTARAVLPGMVDQGSGTVILTGATASIRGGARFAALASAKFALRGLAQSLAREYGPQGIHVVHAVLDGIMWGGISRDLVKTPREQCIEPNDVAEAYLQLIRQPRSAWSHEIDLRPSGESF